MTDFMVILPSSALLNFLIKTTPTIIAGASINAITAIMCPPNDNENDSKNEEAATKVTALTEP